MLKQKIIGYLPYFQNNPALIGSLFMVIGSFFTSFINYLYHLIIARLIGPAEYGVLASVISFGGLLNLIPTSFGLIVTKIVSKENDQTLLRQKVSILYKQSLIFGVLLLSLFLTLVPMISSFLHISDKLILSLVIIGFFIYFPVQFGRAVLQGLLKFNQLVYTQGIENIFRLTVSVSFVLLGLKVLGATAGILIGAIASGVFLWIYLKKMFLATKIVHKDLGLKSLFIQLVPSFILSVSITSFYSSDLILVKHFFNSYDTGLYGALSFLGRIIFFGISPITAVMFPLVTKKISQGGDYKRVLIICLIAALAASSLITLAYLAFPSLIIGSLYGLKYINQVHLLPIFGLFISLVTIAFMLLNYELAIGKFKPIIASLAAAAFQIVLIYAFHSSLEAVVNVSCIIIGLFVVYLLFDIFYLQERTSPGITGVAKS